MFSILAPPSPHTNPRVVLQPRAQKSLLLLRNSVTSLQMERFQPSSFSKQFTSLELTGVKLTGKKLGKGSDATVQEVNWLGTLCAAKQLHDILLEDDSPGGARRFIENFEKECTTWSKLVHPHIVQFLGVFFLSGSHVPILILEKMDISLRGYLEKHKKEEIPLSAKVYILRQVAQALSYLHSRSPPLVHHDLSPNNILLNEVSLVTKVTDFGMSRALDSSKMTRKSSVKGTLAFMAPEALHSPPKYDEKLDVFSYGNVTMTTVTHEWPEPGPPTRYEGDKLIGVNELQRREQYLIAFSPKENELFFPIIRSCLDNRPSHRPTSLQLVAQMRQIEASHPRIAPSGEATIAQLREGKQKETLIIDKEKDVQIHQYRSQLTEKDTQLKQKDTQLRQKDTQLKQKDTQLKQKDAQIRQYRSHLTEKDTQLKQKDEDSGREYALLLQDYQQLQQERDRLKREQLKASQQKPSPPASVQPLSIQLHQHKIPTKLPSASKQEVESQLSKAMNPTSQLERLELKESKSTKKLKIKELGTHKETLHFPHSHGRLWGIAVSPTGNIFVSDFSKHQIHVFNTQRQYIRTFSEQGTGKGQLKGPRGLAVDTNGLVYVANADNRRVEVFKEDGSFVRQIGVGQLERPRNVTIYDDRLFIPDLANHRVFTFNTSGELTQTIGGWGGGPGQFISPTAVAVYNNELVITDWDNNRVQVFSVNGQYNRELLRDQVSGPRDILITPDGEVLIADFLNSRVAIFNTSGDLLHRLDVPEPRGLAINTNSELLVSGKDGVCVFT